MIEDKKMKTVELHHAFLWICDECGKENVCTAIPVDVQLLGLDEKAIGGIAEYLIGEMEIPDDEEDAEEEIDGDPKFYAYPRYVKCKYCKARFRAVPEE